MKRHLRPWLQTTLEIIIFTGIAMMILLYEFEVSFTSISIILNIFSVVMLSIIILVKYGSFKPSNR